MVSSQRFALATDIAGTVTVTATTTTNLGTTYTSTSTMSITWSDFPKTIIMVTSTKTFTSYSIAATTEVTIPVSTHHSLRRSLMTDSFWIHACPLRADISASGVHRECQHHQCHLFDIDRSRWDIYI